jgi:alkylation response protein AidB-like acyl-CoA dehydrogenase
MDIKLFRQETRAWLEENCPQEMRLGRVHFEDGAEVYGSEAGKLWQARMAEKGWTVPLWEKRYGGAGLSPEENNVLSEEMARINALPAWAPASRGRHGRAEDAALALDRPG